MLHVIWNPNAGRGSAHKVIRRLQKAFPDAQFWESKRKVEMPLIIEKVMKQNPEVLLIVGGDGTINSLAYFSEEITCPIIPVPVGSGNGIAHQLGIKRIEDSIKAVDSSNVCKWHIIETNQKIKGLNILGSGFTGFVAHQFATTTRGMMGYVKSFFKTVGVPEIMFEVNGNVIEAWDVSFAVGGEWGNSVVIHPYAHGCSGKSFCVILKKPSWIQFPYHLLLLLSQKHDKSSLWQSTESDKVIITRGSKWGHIDGEPVQWSFPLEVWKSDKYLLFKKA